MKPTITPQPKPAISASKPNISREAKPDLTVKSREIPFWSEKADFKLDLDKYPEDSEGAAKEELTQLQIGFRQRLKAEAQRAQKMTSPNYYCILCFETSEQCDAFVNAIGVDIKIEGDLTLKGSEIAARLHIHLPEAGKMTYNAGPTKPSVWSPYVRRQK